MELSIIAGEPDAADIAALCAVIAARRGGQNPPKPKKTPAWNDPGYRLGLSRNWRQSVLPR